jgi:8-amino-7-oxononanoate synthase
MASLEDSLQEKLAVRKEKGLYRSLKNYTGLVDFCSNDYLGLARSEKLYEAIQEKLRTSARQNGSTGSRLLSGNSREHEAAESKLATIFRAPSTLLFNSGYTANLAVLSSLPQRGDVIVYDELAHACIKDGARLSLASRYSFRHNDMRDLEMKIKKASGKVFIAVESVYSMDGDLCPLEELVVLAEKYGASIILDEAHGTGVFGKNGAGLAVTVGLHSRIPIRIYTFGKAMGIHGACVAGSDTLKSFLINFARPFIYTTAPDLHSIAAMECAFDFLSANEDLQPTLLAKIRLYNSLTTKFDLPGNSLHPIQSLIIPGNNQAARAAARLQASGFDVRPILSPTVPEGSERLRICLHAFNTEKELSSLCLELNALMKTDRAYLNK